MFSDKKTTRFNEIDFLSIAAVITKALTLVTTILGTGGSIVYFYHKKTWETYILKSIDSEDVTLDSMKKQVSYNGIYKAHEKTTEHGAILEQLEAKTTEIQMKSVADQATIIEGQENANLE